MSARTSNLGGRPDIRALSPGDYSLPSGSIISVGPALKRSRVAQTLIDIITLVFLAFFISATALSIPLAIFLLLFVRV